MEIENISKLEDKELVDILKVKVEEEKVSEKKPEPKVEEKKDPAVSLEKEADGKDKEPEKKDIVPEEDPYKDLTPEQLKEKLKVLEESDAVKTKRIKDKDDFINKRNAEIARIRKDLEEKKVLLTKVQVTENDFADDPVEASRKIVREEASKEEIARITMQQILLDNEQRVRTLAPDYDEYINDIIELAKAKGIPQENLSRFRDNPFNGEPDAIIGFYYEAKLNKERKLASIKLKELESRPGEMLKKIDQAARNKPLTAKTGTSDSSDLGDYSESQIANLDREELSRLLKEHTKKEK